MSSQQNTLYPALRQLAEAVLASYQPAPCEGCQDQPTRPYVLAYGKKTSSQSTTVGNTTTTVTQYENLTARAVSLCPACLEAHRQVMLRKALIRLGVTAVVILVCVALIIFGGEDGQVIGAGVGTVGAIIILAFFVQWRTLRTDDTKVGQDKALRLHMDALKAAGFDTFWTDEVA